MSYFCVESWKIRWRCSNTKAFIETRERESHGYLNSMEWENEEEEEKKRIWWGFVL